MDSVLQLFLSYLFPNTVVLLSRWGQMGAHRQRVQQPDAPSVNVPISWQAGIFQPGRGVLDVENFPTRSFSATFTF